VKLAPCKGPSWQSDKRIFLVLGKMQKGIRNNDSVMAATRQTCQAKANMHGRFHALDSELYLLVEI